MGVASNMMSRTQAKVRTVAQLGSSDKVLFYGEHDGVHRPYMSYSLNS